jgi:hypothetical protein
MDAPLSVLASPGAGREKRLDALRELKAAEKEMPPSRAETNNHIHTIYSFSPYTPSMAAYLARRAGLEAAGSVDHDSVGAAREMLEAGRILGMGACVGFEIRVNFSGTPFQGLRLNNPDSLNVNYMTVQGIPADRLDEADAFLAPIRSERNGRNRRQAENASRELAAAGLGGLDFDADVLPLSMAHEGGGVTERHILAAVSGRIERESGVAGIPACLRERLKIGIPAALEARLAERDNPHRLYDLLGLLKTEFLPRIFIQPSERECVSVKAAVGFALSIGAIPAYAYLGDVGESPTGDKKKEEFEDSLLDRLVPGLAELGFLAVAYMPPRNTRAQLARLQALCARSGLLEISGVDINSSRQSFNCPEAALPAYKHLADGAWAIIGHEKLSAMERRLGLFHPDNPLAALPLKERVGRYARAGRALSKGDPAGGWKAEPAALLGIGGDELK